MQEKLYYFYNETDSIYFFKAHFFKRTRKMFPTSTHSAEAGNESTSYIFPKVFLKSTDDGEKQFLFSDSRVSLAIPTSFPF